MDSDIVDLVSDEEGGETWKNADFNANEVVYVNDDGGENLNIAAPRRTSQSSTTVDANDDTDVVLVSPDSAAPSRLRLAYILDDDEDVNNDRDNNIIAVSPASASFYGVPVADNDSGTDEELEEALRALPYIPSSLAVDALTSAPQGGELGHSSRATGSAHVPLPLGGNAQPPLPFVPLCNGAAGVCSAPVPPCPKCAPSYQSPAGTALRSNAYASASTSTSTDPSTSAARLQSSAAQVLPLTTTVPAGEFEEVVEVEEEEEEEEEGKGSDEDYVVSGQPDVDDEDEDDDDNDCNPDADHNQMKGASEGTSSRARPGQAGGMAATDKFARDLVQLSSSSSDATSEAPTPSELRVPLLRHQRQALAWMARREDVTGAPEGYPRGGILADDQGFGKTLSLIALMVTNRPPPPPRRPDTDTATQVAWGNLVVAPTSILRQWAAELEERIEPPYRPKVLIYHGSKRRKDPYDLIRYDIVITSYGVLVQEYPKEFKVFNESTQKYVKRCRVPGALFRVDWFRVVLDEAQAIKNRHSESHHAAVALRTRCRWVATGTPIQNSIDDIYSQFLFLRYHVVSTYKEWRERFKAPLEGATNERRRERVFKQFQAILGPVLLRRAKHDRIDGKPVMPLPPRNVRVLELDLTHTEREFYSQQELLAVQQMNSLVEDMHGANGMTTALVILLRLRQACNHPKLCSWNSTTQFKFSDDELDAVEMRLDSHSLFRSLPEDVRNRLYRELGPESSIPQTCPICMDIVSAEGIVTKCGHVFCSADFDSWAGENDTCPTCRTILGADGAVMNLDAVRKEVHALVRREKREDIKEEGTKVDDVEPKKRENAIAMRLLGKRPKPEDMDGDQEDKVKKEEDVVKEEEEVKPTRKRQRRGRAAKKKRKGGGKRVSKEEDRIAGVEEGTQAADAGNGAGPSTSTQTLSTSTKIKAFIKDFTNIMEHTQDKVLCFSQWTRMLDLVQEQVLEAGYEFVRLDGGQNLDERAEAVRMFHTRNKCRLFLISLKAGSTGLNLTVANRVYLLDSWWNPAVEDQAIDRVHRLGQLKDVEVVKLKIRGSVEERIFLLQERKRAIADGALGREGLKMLGRKRLSMEEVLGLFQDVYDNVARRAEERNDAVVADMVQSLVQTTAVHLGQNVEEPEPF